MSKKNINGAQLQKIVDHFDINYTFESDGIEGKSLSLQDTHLVINEGIPIGGIFVREHLEAINHIEAIDFYRARSIVHINDLYLLYIDWF